MFSPDTLKGKVALITGGATGIGFAIAKHYTKLGAQVALVSRNEERLKAAATELSDEGGVATAYRADVRNYSDVKNAVDQVRNDLGSIDILINNAAGNFFCPTAQLTPNGWRTVIDIDLNGTFHCCHAAYPALQASAEGGCIISIVTMLGVSGWPGAAHAAAAKAGILSLSRTLAVEWGPDNIRVNTISPGPIGDTEGVRRLYEQRGYAESERRRTALNRFGRTDDIAAAAVYLASPAASYITGENLIIDGGRWLKYTNEQPK